VTRGSCTDKTWGSEACAGYCKTVDTSSQVVITPCTSGDSSNTFVCGLNTTDCQTDTNTFSLPSDMGIVLRPNQIAQLVGSSLESATPSGAATAEGFTAGALAGVAVGVALPLLVALGVIFYLLRREQRRFSKPKLMYKLPDEVTQDDFTFTPRPVRTTAAFSSRPSSQISRATGGSTLASRRGSGATMGTLHVGVPQSFMERYETMKKNAQTQLTTKEMMMMSPVSSPRHELDSPSREVARYELSNSRMSNS